MAHASFDAPRTVLSSIVWPVFTYNQIADHLTTGLWGKSLRAQRPCAVCTGGTITVTLNWVTTLGKKTSLQALDAWSAVSGWASKFIL